MNHDVRHIRNIWAVGRNYADHAKELGNQAPPTHEAPMIFLKAGSSIVPDGEAFHLPSFSRNVHHELEIAFQFGADFRFRALALAIDLTARDIQNALKAKGYPWTLAKSFRDSCLLGPIVDLDDRIDLQNLDFSLHINGELRQHGNTRDMIHSAEKLRLYVLEHFPVAEGDLLLTGTPAGVGALVPGDKLEANIKDAKGTDKDLARARWQTASLGL